MWCTSGRRLETWRKLYAELADADVPLDDLERRKLGAFAPRLGELTWGCGRCSHARSLSFES